MNTDDTAAVICARYRGRESVTESIIEKCAYCNEEVILSRTSLRKLGIMPYVCCCTECTVNLPKQKVEPLSKEQMQEITALGISREKISSHIKDMEDKLGLGQKI